MATPASDAHLDAEPERSGGHHHHFRAALGWSTVAVLLTQVGGAISQIVFARVLGPERFAALAVALASVTAASTLATAGVDRAAVVLLGRQRSQGDARAVVRAVLDLAVPCASVGAVLALGILLAARFDAEWHILTLVAVTAGAEVVRWLTSEVPRAWNSPQTSAALGAGARLLTATVAVLAISSWVDVTLESILVCLLAASIATATIGWRVLSRHADPRRRSDEDPSTASYRRALLALGGPAAVGNAGRAALNQADVVIIGALFTPVAVSGYVIASRLVNMLDNVIVILSVAALPTISSTNETSSAHQSLVRASATLATVAMTASVVGIALLYPDVVRLLFGADFPAPRSLFLLLSIGQLANAFTGIAASVLFRSNLTRVLAVVYVSAGIIAVVSETIAAAVFNADIRVVAAISSLAWAAANVVVALICVVRCRVNPLPFLNPLRAIRHI